MVPMKGLDPAAARLRVSYRVPTLADAARVRSLVDACKPLDVNSTYAYLLLCTHFSATCVIAERDHDLIGFLSGYLKPSDPAVLFIWQVAVSPTARGMGIATRLLEEVLNRPACRLVQHMETTITPSNEASWALFRTFARNRRASCTRSALFRSDHFGSEGHDEEQLLRIRLFSRPGEQPS